MRLFSAALLLLAGCATTSTGAGTRLPGLYYRMMEDGLRKFETEAKPDPVNPSHTAAALLCAAVLHVRGRGDHLERAKEYGDALAAEDEAGRFEMKLDHHRNTYLWLDAWRILQSELGEARKARWRARIRRNVEKLAADLAERQDYPRFQSPYIITSPNHFSLWASTTHLAGVAFGIREWEELGAKVMHLFATREQSPDGYWGEHSPNGPTTGYDYLTLTGVALYYEHSGDPAALEAMRRNTIFHKHFTYPDGTPVEVINDRNRHWRVTPWGHFGFSHFPDGRRYAEFLTGFLEGNAGLVTLGRIAQNALYWHDGPTDPIPQDVRDSAYRMRVPAGIRRRGPWTVCLSALIDTQAVKNRFYLDRQGHLSVFHEKHGQVIVGANSKRQPEIATFNESFGGKTYHLPTSSRLRMRGKTDLLSLAYNTFFADIEASITGAGTDLEFRIHRTASADDRMLHLQLKVHEGDLLKTANEEFKAGPYRVELMTDQVRHHGWTVRLDRPAKLVWPYYPFNPYANGPEKSLEHAVAVLSIPIRMQRPTEPGKRLRFDRLRVSVTAD